MVGLIIIGLLLVVAAALMLSGLIPAWRAERRKRSATSEESVESEYGFQMGVRYSIWTSFPNKVFSGNVVELTPNHVVMHDPNRGMSEGWVKIGLSDIVAFGPKSN